MLEIFLFTRFIAYLAFGQLILYPGTTVIGMIRNTYGNASTRYDISVMKTGTHNSE